MIGLILKVALATASRPPESSPAVRAALPSAGLIMSSVPAMPARIEFVSPVWSANSSDATPASFTLCSNWRHSLRLAVAAFLAAVSALRSWRSNAFAISLASFSVIPGIEASCCWRLDMSALYESLISLFSEAIRHASRRRAPVGHRRDLPLKPFRPSFLA